MSRHHDSVAYVREVAGMGERVWPDDVTLALDALEAEVAELEARDLTGEEYNQLMEILMMVRGRDALILANSIRNKFGASARRRKEAPA